MRFDRTMCCSAIYEEAEAAEPQFLLELSAQADRSARELVLHPEEYRRAFEWLKGLEPLTRSPVDRGRAMARLFRMRDSRAARVEASQGAEPARSVLDAAQGHRVEDGGQAESAPAEVATASGRSGFRPIRRPRFLPGRLGKPSEQLRYGWHLVVTWRLRIAEEYQPSIELDHARVIIVLAALLFHDQTRGLHHGWPEVDGKTEREDGESSFGVRAWVELLVNCGSQPNAAAIAALLDSALAVVQFERLRTEAMQRRAGQALPGESRALLKCVVSRISDAQALALQCFLAIDGDRAEGSTWIPGSPMTISVDELAAAKRAQPDAQWTQLRHGTIQRYLREVRAEYDRVAPPGQTREPLADKDAELDSYPLRRRSSGSSRTARRGGKRGSGPASGSAASN